MVEVSFKYNIEDRVKVKAIDIEGQIDSMATDIRGEMYRVVYWNDGVRYSVWMYEWELEEVK